MPDTTEDGPAELEPWQRIPWDHNEWFEAQVVVFTDDDPEAEGD